MNELLRLWDAMAISLAVVVIVVAALGMIVGFVELDHAFKRLGLALVCLVLLLILPQIIAGIWHKLSFWQHFGMILLFGLAVMLILQHGKSSAKGNKPKH